MRQTKSSGATVIHKHGWFDECKILATLIPCELVWGNPEVAKTATREAWQTLAEMAERSDLTEEETDLVKYWKAIILSHAGHPDLLQPDEAVSLFNAILPRFGHLRDVQTGLGAVLYAAGDFHAAEESFRKIRNTLREEDRQFATYNDLKRQMMDLFAQERYEEAHERHEQMKAMNIKEPRGGEHFDWPEHPAYSLYLALIAFQLGDDKTALSEFKDVRARWGSCDTFPKSARLFREVASRLGEPISESIPPTELPIESARPIVESLNLRDWRGVH